MSELAEDLASYGLNTKVICAHPTYIKDFKIEESLVSSKSPRVDSHHGVAIRRVWSFLFDKNKNVGRILNGISCFLSMLPLVFSESKNSFLIFNTNPALLPLLGFIGAKLGGKKYAILIYDLWPELPANIGMIKSDSTIYRAIDFLNKLCFKNANGIIVLSEAMKRRVLNKTPRMENKIHIIHNWVDGSRIGPVPKDNNLMLKKLGFEQKKIIMYSGNLGRYQPMEVMIGAANELREINDIMFLFVGDGGKKKTIQEMATSLKLNNVKFIPFQPLDRLSESLSMADISLVGIYPKNEGVIMPSKLYGLLAIGKPIICISDPNSEVAKILKKAKAGFHSSIDDPKELAQKIVALLDDSKKAEKIGQNGRRYFLEHFERKRATKQWKFVLENILTENI